MCKIQVSGQNINEKYLLLFLIIKWGMKTKVNTSMIRRAVIAHNGQSKSLEGEKKDVMVEVLYHNHELTRSSPPKWWQ